uniref:Uncharacterized protein n=1 Tax=Glycine max TaxID=3847 RepID=C6TFJ1_SOYBN|nr:unknown [Glycine max]
MSWKLVSEVSRCSTSSGGSAARENGNNRVCKPDNYSNFDLSTLWNWTPREPPWEASSTIHHATGSCTCHSLNFCVFL